MDLSRILVRGMHVLAWFFGLMGLFHPLLTHPYSSQRPEVMMYLLVYVDDIILISSSDAAANCLMSLLSGDFAVKDLGALHYFLGLEVSQSSAGLTLTQHKYSMDLLHRAGMLKCKHANTPMSATDRLSALDGDPLSPDDATEYRSLIGGLQYLTIYSDLTF
jgi:histone deacetylase 1/2